MVCGFLWDLVKLQNLIHSWVGVRGGENRVGGGWRQTPFPNEIEEMQRPSIHGLTSEGRSERKNTHTHKDIVKL